MSSTWLYWLATWFRPLFEVLRQLLTDLYVFPICLAAGLGVGAYHLLGRGQRGRGWGIILSTFAIGIIGIVLTRDPLTELYSEHGLLTQGRNLGFTVAQAAMTNGAIAPGGSGAQLHHLTGLIADATIRMPMQLWNFGGPVDHIGTCADAGLSPPGNNHKARYATKTMPTSAVSVSLTPCILSSTSCRVFNEWRLRLQSTYRDTPFLTTSLVAARERSYLVKRASWVIDCTAIGGSGG